MDASNRVAQAVRESHCAKPADADHGCVGTCTITPQGISLSCKLCGDLEEGIAPVGVKLHRVGGVRLPADNVVAARRILSVAGLDYDALSPEVQLEVARVVGELLATEMGVRS
jgi:hypothetical protein